MAGRAIPCRRKKGAHEGRTLVFVDEAGFYLLPAVVTTYAPVGETPVLREVVTRDHLSVISAVTPAGLLRMQVYDEAITGAHVVRFLKYLGRRLPGERFWIFWDSAPIHRGQAVREFLATAPPARYRMTLLPGYAPDLNPDEGVWNKLKEDELANVSCLDLPELRVELTAATRRLQRHPEIVRGFFKEAGYG
jgi:transposase